jgi:DNA-binding NarL/FixJ family response regulator
MAAPLSLLLVDDDPHFCQGIRQLFKFYPQAQMPPLHICGEAHSVAEAIRAISTHNPDLVLLDLHLGPDADLDNDRHSGITVLKHLQGLGHQTKVLILSGHDQDKDIFKAMGSGAKGYVLKQNAGTQLFEAIATLVQASIYLPPEVSTGFFRQFQAKTNTSRQTYADLKFTEREEEVLRWLVQGASTEEISQQLYVTGATVKAHLTSIFKKLEVTNRTQAIIELFKRGFVEIL